MSGPSLVCRHSLASTLTTHRSIKLNHSPLNGGASLATPSDQRKRASEETLAHLPYLRLRPPPPAGFAGAFARILGGSSVSQKTMVLPRR